MDEEKQKEGLLMN